MSQPEKTRRLVPDGVRSILAVSLCLTCQVASADMTGRVVRVNDGDTLTVLVDRKQVKVRIASIDAPELGQPFGRRSGKALSDLCAGKNATFEETGKDRYGRTIGPVNCGGLDAATEQVRAGLAWVYVKYAPKGSALYRIEERAREERIGLWESNTRIPPWEWRQRQRGMRIGDTKGGREQ